MPSRVLRVRQASPVIGVRGVPVSTAVSPYGTQFVAGTLVLNPTMNIVLRKSTFTNGMYVLFDYTAAGASFPGGQPALNTLVANSKIDISDLASIGVTGFQLVDDPVNEKVYLLLTGGFDVGTQYVNGNLTFLGPHTIVLNQHLYNGAGTYKLFDVSGTINTSSLANVSFTVQNTGLRAGKLYAPDVTGPVYVTLSEVMPSLG
jgi:hypothetical protein